MRKIKFRGFSPDHLRWYHGDLVTNYGDMDYLMIGDWSLGEDRVVDPESVGQCTGIIDSEGNVIYEGDIIKINFSTEDIYGEPTPKLDSNGNLYAIALIEFSDGAFRFKIIENKNKDENELILDEDDIGATDYAFCECVVNNYLSKYIEVIGNKYQNPELLKQV